MVNGLFYIVLKNCSHLFTLIDDIFLILIMMIQLIVFEQEMRKICMSTSFYTMEKIRRDQYDFFLQIFLDLR
jgi:hypothetical protein